MEFQNPDRIEITFHQDNMRFATIFELGIAQKTLKSCKECVDTEFQDPDRILNKISSRY